MSDSKLTEEELFTILVELIALGVIAQSDNSPMIPVQAKKYITKDVLIRDISVTTVSEALDTLRMLLVYLAFDLKATCKEKGELRMALLRREMDM